MGATLAKLDEAIFFLGQIESNSFNPPHLGYYLSAFISSSRSVLWVMRHEFCHVDGWLEWYESKIPSPEETRFLESLNNLRTRAVKKGTPSVQYMIDFRIPPGGLTNEKVEWLHSCAGQALIVTAYTEDERPPSASTEHGISFNARVREKKTVSGTVFATRGGDLVHLASSVCLVCVVRRTRETRQTRAPDSRAGLVFLTRGKPVAATSEWSILWP